MTEISDAGGIDLWFWLAVGAIVFLLLLSAFFSGSETALTAVSRPRMHHLARKGNRRASMVRRLAEKQGDLLGALLLGNNLVNILAASIATSVLIRLFGEAGVAYATLGMTLLVLIFAEVLPKTFAINHPDRAALAVAPVVQLVVAALSPISKAIQWIVRSILRFLGDKPEVATREAAEEEREEALRGAIELHDGDDETQSERQMLKSILELGDLEMAEVMTHRSNVVMVDGDRPADEIVAEVLASPYTRIPIWRDAPENIVGVLHAKALLRAVRAVNGGDPEGLNIDEVASPPWFVPESTTLLDQLQEFRRRREHFALIVDEYGAFMGVATLEDILEEIVGDIADEHDVPLPGVRRQPDGSYVAPGRTPIRDLNREFDWSLPDDDATTLAGLIMHEARMLPEAGQTFEFHGYRFRILRRSRNLIAQIRVTPPRRRAAEEEDAANG